MIRDERTFNGFFARCVISHTPRARSTKNIYESLRARIMWNARTETQNNNKQSSSLLCCVHRWSFGFDFSIKILINIKFLSRTKKINAANIENHMAKSFIWERELREFCMYTKPSRKYSEQNLFELKHLFNNQKVEIFVGIISKK